MENAKLHEIENLANVFVQLDYAKVPSSILAFLMIAPEGSLTFNRIVSELGFSKASVSTGLRFLEEKGMISYRSQLNSRERFIFLNPTGMVDWISARMGVLEKMKVLFYEVAKHHEKNYGDQFRMIAAMYEELDEVIAPILQKFREKLGN